MDRTHRASVSTSRIQVSPRTWGRRLTVGRPSTSQRNWFLRHKVLSGVLAFVLLVFVAGALGSAGEDPTPAAADTSAGAVAIRTWIPFPNPRLTRTRRHRRRRRESTRMTSGRATPRSKHVTTSTPTGTASGMGMTSGPKDPKVQTRDDVDTDKDGVPDYKDDFPKDAKYSKDTDGDQVADQLDDFPKDPNYSQDTDDDGVADSEDAFPSDPSRSKVTLAMENALEAAQDYLDYSAFSRLGLIDQLSSKYGSGFKVEDATWAVDQLSVDWKQRRFARPRTISPTRPSLARDSSTSCRVRTALNSPWKRRPTRSTRSACDTTGGCAVNGAHRERALKPHSVRCGRLDPPLRGQVAEI